MLSFLWWEVLQACARFVIFCMCITLPTLPYIFWYQMVCGFKILVYIYHQTCIYGQYVAVLYTHSCTPHVDMYTYMKTIAHTHFIVSSEDYTSVSMTLGPFTSQRPRQCFSISIINDLFIELDEAFTARLTLIPASVTTISPDRIIVDPPQTTVQIADNDLSKLIVVRVPSLKPRPHVCTCEGMDG